MSKIGPSRVVKFEAWHLDWLDKNNINGIGLSSYISKEHAKQLENHSISWTGLQGGKIVGSGGFTPLWDGVAEIWLLLNPDAFKRKKVALRLMKHILNDIIQREKYHRIQAVVLKGYEKGMKFAEFFGFENEGLMKKYTTNKEDFYRYARII